MFEENDINYGAFIALEESDLRDLNVSVGDRAIMRKEIKTINIEENTGNNELILDI